MECSVIKVKYRRKFNLENYYIYRFNYFEIMEFPSTEKIKHSIHLTIEINILFWKCLKQNI